MTIIDPLFTADVVEDPHGYYAQLRATDPVHELPGTGTFLVTRMDLIHEVVAKPASDRFRERDSRNRPSSSTIRMRPFSCSG